ncbi:hypothetical protein [Embleya sp. NPDC005971]|uniref:hypothetical protein n=1 Tax=Embleya sp. NPDC005971 TaxID=3156724 RepID=UPI0033CF895F
MNRNARLSVRLPGDLVETARRAAYWTSEPAVLRLMAWRDGHGLSPTEAALRERQELSGRIVTVGDLMRDALAQVLQRELPPASDDGPPIDTTVV